jgi:hypothetical protein
VRLEGLCQMTNSIDTIGDQTRDLLTSSMVAQPTAPLRCNCVNWAYCFLAGGSVCGDDIRAVGTRVAQSLSRSRAVQGMS